MGNLRRTLNDLPIPTRLAFIGALALGITGGIAGLIIGLFTYPPTAWAAVAEVGGPAALLGGLTGFVVGFLVQTVRRTRKHLAS